MSDAERMAQVVGRALTLLGAALPYLIGGACLGIGLAFLVTVLL